MPGVLVKRVAFTRHARRRVVERGTTEDEVIQTIRDAPWSRVDLRRYAATKWYPFGQEHEGSFYAGKDVRPIFVDEPERLVVVTVYVYFNQQAGP
jgi:hypothetical protein